MASNDMNSWDEDPDELLRRRWQQTFTDFEVQPRAVVRKRVLDSLGKTPRRRRLRWLATTAIVLMLITGVVYQVRLSESIQLTSSHLPTTRSTRLPRPHLARRIRPRMSLEDSSALLNNSNTFSTPSTLTTQQPQLADTQRSTLTAERPSRDAHQAGQSFPTAQHWAHAHQPGEVTPTPVHLSRRQQDSFVGSRIPDQSPSQFESKGDGAETNSAGQSMNMDDNLLPNSSAQTESDRPDSQLPINWNTLTSRALGYLPISFGSISRRLPVLTGIPAPFTTSQPGVARTPLRYQWFVEAVPLSSFQWMTTPQSSSAYLSQVSTPAAFSPTTWGYQVNGGIRFRRWQIYLTTGQLRRWAYYTVSENQYRIDPNVSTPNQLVRETHAVVENKSLPLVGIGVSQYQYFSRDRYVVEIGGQISYLPTSDQPLAGLRAGISRQVRLRQRMAAQVGVNVEYGLNRLLSEQQQLIIRPVVVGLSFRVQPPLVR